MIQFACPRAVQEGDENGIGGKVYPGAPELARLVDGQGALWQAAEHRKDRQHPPQHDTRAAECHLT